MGGLPEALRVFGGAAALEALLESLTLAVFFNPGDSDDGPGEQPHATC
jgi:hypothetical protein